MKDNKCIVHGCSNHADQGRFVGEMCSPYYDNDRKSDAH